MIILYIKTIKIKEKGLDMGRKRIDPADKKIVLPISIKKKYVDKLREKHDNISQIVEELVKQYLDR